MLKALQILSFVTNILPLIAAGVQVAELTGLTGAQKKSAVMKTLVPVFTSPTEETLASQLIDQHVSIMNSASATQGAMVMGQNLQQEKVNAASFGARAGQVRV